MMMMMMMMIIIIIIVLINSKLSSRINTSFSDIEITLSSVCSV